MRARATLLSLVLSGAMLTLGGCIGGSTSTTRFYVRTPLAGADKPDPTATGTTPVFP